MRLCSYRHYVFCKSFLPWKLLKVLYGPTATYTSKYNFGRVFYIFTQCNYLRKISFKVKVNEGYAQSIHSKLLKKLSSVSNIQSFNNYGESL